ncbi:MAG: hypothetical protein ACNI3A_16680 [Desulfovibrio sp.]|uniref:hypothetical protein n=1 Tax=Desulfovibrio sp. 7SRBS1 TaxID=3378064 RepID=UPI003B418B97
MRNAKEIRALLEETADFQNKFDLRLKEGYFKNKLASCLIVKVTDTELFVDPPSTLRLDKKLVGREVECFLTKTVKGEKFFYNFTSPVTRVGTTKKGRHILGIDFPRMLNSFSRRGSLRTSLPPHTLKSATIWSMPESGLPSTMEVLGEPIVTIPEELGRDLPRLVNISCGGIRVGNLNFTDRQINKLFRLGQRCIINLQVEGPNNSGLLELWFSAIFRNDMALPLPGRKDVGLQFMEEGKWIFTDKGRHLQWAVVDCSNAFSLMADLSFKWHTEMHRLTMAKARENE